MASRAGQNAPSTIKLTVLLGVAALLVAASGWAQSREAATPLQALPGTPMTEMPSTTSETTFSSGVELDTGDLIEVRTFDTPELSGKLRVDEKGEITLPIGGAVTVRGLTAEQVGVAIEERFRQRNILRDPHVDIFVDEYATQGVTVAGEVKMPGIYPWSGKHSVLDFISAAGGLTPYASRTVTLSRKDREQVVTFQLQNSLQTPGGADLEAHPGDRILVTRAGVVYVVGDVGRPGGYLIENTGTVTVLKALALAQGMNKTAKFDAKLLRNSSGKPVETDLPLKKILANQAADPKLQDGDILFVPVSGGKNFADKGVTAILQTAVGVVIYGRL
ncbi:MAG TPA: polysaccharide biosynthesis/export family protein [Bryocella sp.]|nr:polysaccharide biosynthesis/export family protein [Bryocella sp.]